MDDKGQLQQNTAIQQQPPIPPNTRGFAIASMVCGISSLLLCCLGLSLPLAALGILFAVLSHRKGHYLSGFSITGIITGCSGMVLGIIYILLWLFIYEPEEPQITQEPRQEYSEDFGEEVPDEPTEEDSMPPNFDKYFEDFPYFEGYDMPPYSDEYGGEYSPLPFFEKYGIPDDFPDDFSSFGFY